MKNYPNCKRCNGNGTILFEGEALDCPECEMKEFVENTERLMPINQVLIVKNWDQKTPKNLLFYFTQPDFAGGRDWYIQKLERGLVRRQAIGEPKKSLFDISDEKEIIEENKNQE